MDVQVTYRQEDLTLSNEVLENVEEAIALFQQREEWRNAEDVMEAIDVRNIVRRTAIPLLCSLKDFPLIPLEWRRILEMLCRLLGELFPEW